MTRSRDAGRVHQGQHRRPAHRPLARRHRHRSAVHRQGVPQGRRQAAAQRANPIRSRRGPLGRGAVRGQEGRFRRCGPFAGRRRGLGQIGAARHGVRTDPQNRSQSAELRYGPTDLIGFATYVLAPSGSPKMQSKSAQIASLRPDLSFNRLQCKLTSRNFEPDRTAVVVRLLRPIRDSIGARSAGDKASPPWTRLLVSSGSPV